MSSFNKYRRHGHLFDVKVYNQIIHGWAQKVICLCAYIREGDSLLYVWMTWTCPVHYNGLIQPVFPRLSL